MKSSQFYGEAINCDFCGREMAVRIDSTYGEDVLYCSPCEVQDMDHPEFFEDVEEDTVQQCDYCRNFTEVNAEQLCSVCQEEVTADTHWPKAPSEDESWTWTMQGHLDYVLWMEEQK